MKVTTINSIEISSMCNNTCEYCPAAVQGRYRKTGFMTMEIFNKALEFVKYFNEQGTQKELNLFGVGESLMNPLFPIMLKKAFEVEPMIRPLHLNTNGRFVTKELVELFNLYLNHLDITAHNPRDTIVAYRLCKDQKFKLGFSADFWIHPNDWAGQVDWFKSEKSYPCPWLRNGQAWIMSDGNISTCCFDAFAQGVIGNVFESKPEKLEVKPYKLCTTCHQTYDTSVFEKEKSKLILVK